MNSKPKDSSQTVENALSKNIMMKMSAYESSLCALPPVVILLHHA